MSDKTGGPAFPLPLGTANCSEPEQSGGMTLRDYFAAKAMTGALADSSLDLPSGHEATFASWCYAMADAMIEARKGV